LSHYNFAWSEIDTEKYEWTGFKNI
jgi:hypothetical protein